MSHANLEPHSRELPRRTQLLAAGAFALALAIVLGVASWVGRERAPPVAPRTEAGAFQATPEERANIAVEPVRTRSFSDQVVTDGKLSSNDDRTLQVFAPFTGRVTRVFVSAGQAVRPGQPLASLAASEAIQAQSDLQTADSSERQARVQLDQARVNAKRQDELYKADAASQRDDEQARNDLAAAEQAEANATTAKAAVVARMRMLDLSAAAAGSKSGGLGTIVSPIGGVVTQRQVGEGQFVNSVAGGAAQPLLVVSDTRTLWLVANLRDADAQAVRVGDRVQARIAALDGRLITGRIASVSPTVDPTSRRVAVRADIANPRGQLRPEMFADVEIMTGPPRNALAIPRSAIVRDGDKTRVWVAGPNNAFKLRDVALGVDQDGFVEVRTGLSPQDRVATSGALFLDEAGKGDE